MRRRGKEPRKVHRHYIRVSSSVCFGFGFFEHADYLSLNDLRNLPFRWSIIQSSRRHSPWSSRPGRLIDHLQITSSLSLQVFAVLILDEAGRMRSDGMDLLLNLQKSFVLVPHQVAGQAAKAGVEGGRCSSPLQSPMRKTLAQLSMHRLIRLFVDPKKSLARGPTQEFVWVQRENERMAILLVLCVRTAK